MQCAWTATRRKASHLQTQFHRLRARRGPKRAIRADAASILAAVWHMLRDGTFRRDPGPDHFSHRVAGGKTARLVQHLTSLGYTVQPPAQPAPV